MATRKTKIEARDIEELSLDVSGTSIAEEVDEMILELQLKMATSSINHEYARQEFDDTHDYERKEELLRFMNDCRSEYLSARQSLITHDPLALEKFEADLLKQKQSVNTQYYM